MPIAARLLLMSALLFGMDGCMSQERYVIDKSARTPLQARHTPNRMITAGSVLTWIGTAVSLAGTVMVAVGKVQDSTPLFYAGGISALAAEPIMWTGTGLWIAGAMRRPSEAPPPAAASTAASTEAPATRVTD
ncbi:MAG: hypothetical protein JNM83_25095 [Myxococcales bacterium]|nr:hypothetical protein [Myxococcales bacterium]